MPDSVSVPRRIEDQYLTRLRGLPRVTQRLLLVAAADPVGDRVLLARAAHTLDLDMGALELAVDAGLLDSGAGVRFRHPLLRSAVSPTSSTATPSNCFPAPAWFLTSRGHDCVTANGCGATSSYRRCHAVATRLR